MDYRTEKDKNYYSSDLSKWIDEFCTHEMTSINLDIVQYKRSLNQLRFVEYKHSNEKMKWGQKELLILLSKLKPTYIICGDPPFESSEIIRISDNKTIWVNEEELKKFLNFEYVDIEDIREEIPF